MSARLAEDHADRAHSAQLRSDPIASGRRSLLVIAVLSALGWAILAAIGIALGVHP